MRTHWTSRFAILLCIVGLSGCATGKSGSSSWNPLTWGGSSPKSTAPDVGKYKYDGVAKAGPAAASQPTGMAGVWKSTTDFVSAPFKSKPKIPDTVIAKDDAVSLSVEIPKVGPGVYLAAGRMHEGKGDLEGAEKQYERALQVGPNDLNSLVTMARLKDKQNKYDTAVLYYQKALAAHPKSGLVHNDLGLCYARHQQLAAAQRELTEAVALTPDNSMYRNNLAAVLVEGNRDAEAYQVLAAVNPPAVAHYNLAFLLNQRGNNESAAAHLQQALQIDPSLAAAQALLAQVQPAGGTAVAALPASAGFGTPVSTAGYQPREVGSAIVRPTEDGQLR